MLRKQKRVIGECLRSWISKARSSQVWGHTPEQRVDASILRRYSFGLRLAIAQTATDRDMPGPACPYPLHRIW